MGLKKIAVEGLFGNLNHEITLNKEGITLIHGPNGCGKTTILNLLMSLKKHDMKAVQKIHFKKLILTSNSDHVLTIEQGPFTRGKKSTNALLKTSIIGNGSQRPQQKFYEKNDLYDLRDEKLKYFIKQKFNEVDDPEVLKKIENAMFFNYPKGRSNGEGTEPRWFSDFFKSVKLEYIETQRLLKISKHDGSNDEIINVINIYSDELKKIINDKFNESAAISQTSERTFPHRLLTLSDDEIKTEQVVRDDYEKTQSKIKNLMSIGLIEFEDIIPLPQRELDVTEIKVISLNLYDINSKLQVYDDVISKIELFLDVISSKLRNKEFSINRKDGFIFKTYESELSKSRGKFTPIEPSLLSSGEQHQIVLFYKLIFKSDESCLFLIDEPEISLHVDWQRKFLSDISTIANISNKSFLIATHSPQIIGPNRNLAVSLDGGILYD